MPSSGERPWSRLATGIRRVDDAIVKLAELDRPGAVLDGAPAALAQSADLDAVVLSRIDQGALTVVATAGPLAAEVRLRPGAVQYPYVEADAVRDGDAVVLPNAMRARRPAIVELPDALGPHAVAIAPVPLDGRPSGLLHAARADARGGLDEADAALVLRFARSFGETYERVALRAQLLRSTRRVQDATAELLGRLRALAPASPSPAVPAPGVAELTQRERAVIQLVAAGEGNRAIAAALTVSEGTVKHHMKSILRKLDARTRTEAVYRFLGET